MPPRASLLGRVARRRDRLSVPGAILLPVDERACSVVRASIRRRAGEYVGVSE